MNIPRGFIEDENGVLRRNNYIFKEGQILKEETLLPNEEAVNSLLDSTVPSLDEAIRLALSYNSDTGNPTRDFNIYINKSGEEFKITDKQNKDTVAIITTDNNTYQLEPTPIINQDDTEALKSDDKDNAKAPEEIKDLNTKPETLTEADEDQSTKEQPEQETKQDNLALNSTYFIRRPNNLEELKEKINKRLVTQATYKVVDEISLSQEEFDNYAANLRQDAKFLKTFRPTPTDADFTCLAVKAPDGTTLLIDNSGYDSAQYVGLLD